MGCGQKKWDSENRHIEQGLTRQAEPEKVRENLWKLEKKESAEREKELHSQLALYKDAYIGLHKRFRELQEKYGEEA